MHQSVRSAWCVTVLQGSQIIFCIRRQLLQVKCRSIVTLSQTVAALQQCIAACSEQASD